VTICATTCVDYVTTGLGDTDAVLVVDETGDLKKGTCTVGVQRQYTGTAGRIENAQVGVYLTYAGTRGHAMIDRELYLPKSWTDNDQRCAHAGVPDDIEFLTKPALATAMICRALDAGTPARWAAGDEVYGAHPALRAELEIRKVGYVLGIGCDRRIPDRPDRVPTASRPRWGWCARTHSPPACRNGPGSGFRLGRGRRGSATTTGP
jgi:SRSO17 transposase